MQPALCHPLSDWDVPSPLLLNTWKHHAGALRQRIREAVAGGPAGMERLAQQVVVIGTELMDLYHGAKKPALIAEELRDALVAEGRFDLPAFRAWVEGNGGYTVLPLDDGSRWVFRLGDEADRYVHVHPARYAPRTQRVRANVLKTAVLVLAAAALEGASPLDRDLVNRVRQRWLGLAPLGRALKGDQGGIGEVIALLGGAV